MAESLGEPEKTRALFVAGEVIKEMLPPIDQATRTHRQVWEAIHGPAFLSADERLQPGRKTRDRTPDGLLAPGARIPRRDAGHDPAVAGTGGSPARPAASRSCAARSRRSHGRSRSGRPK